MKKTSYSLKSKAEENLSIDKKSYLGLCSYCKSELNCTFIRDLNRPVYECEEFEEVTFVSIQIPNKKYILLANPSKNPSPQKDPLHSYIGLCSNCEERETCVYPKPEGGVWRCDEYR